jgi:collagenase-like PrtC family protease
MMKILAPTNWDTRLIEIFSSKGISEVYGKLSADIVGGGRASYLSASLSKKRFSEYIKVLRKEKIGFNYLLNATCMNNTEFTRQGQKKIRNLVEWLIKLGVSSATVANPYLLELLKKCYPQLKICVSTMAQVDCLRRAQYWESLGADVITLSEISVNRNFRLIKLIRAHLNCELQLIANNSCLQYCPFAHYHSVCQSHASQENSRTKRFLIDYCRFKCRFLYLSNCELFLRSTWIRPEDLSFYHGLGINSIKLVDRLMSTPALIKIIQSYADGGYNGNLADLLPKISGAPRFSSDGRSTARRIKLFLSFLRPFDVNIFLLYKTMRQLPACEIYIDNKALNGFIEGLASIDCQEIDCQECKYCHNWSTKVVKYDKDKLQKTLEGYSTALSKLASGALFKYATKDNCKMFTFSK